MKASQKLLEACQSLRLDYITRQLLTSGTLKRYVDELSVTGLTWNPTISEQAIKTGAEYDSMIRRRLKAGKAASGYSSR
jgi:transaldolase